MAYDVYSTGDLFGMFGVVEQAPQFIRNTFFKSDIPFETQYVLFDKVARARRLAPLVSPGVEAKAESLRSFTTNMLTPAYLKAKKVIDPTKVLARTGGEALSGSYSPQERRAILTAQAVNDLQLQVERMIEYMCVQLMIAGRVTLSSADFGSVTLDMVRPSANTVTLTGSSTWATQGHRCLNDLITWSMAVQTVSGYAPRVVVMSPDAYQLFIQSPDVLDVMQSFRQTSGNVNLAGYPVGAPGQEAALMANVAGFEIWTYQSQVADINGNISNLLPPNTVILGSPDGAGGAVLYGAILDHGSLAAVPVYPKMYERDDPSEQYVMLQSSPCPVLGWSEATFAATVA